MDRKMRYVKLSMYILVIIVGGLWAPDWAFPSHEKPVIWLMSNVGNDGEITVPYGKNIELTMGNNFDDMEETTKHPVEILSGPTFTPSKTFTATKSSQACKFTITVKYKDKKGRPVVTTLHSNVIIIKTSAKTTPTPGAGITPTPVGYHTPTPVPTSTPVGYCTPSPIPSPTHPYQPSPTTTPRMDLDQDGDGLTDYEEILTYKTEPTDPDSDHDGLTDGEEVIDYKTNPLMADTDQDDLRDGKEVKSTRTNPIKADTDGDKLKDGREIALGTDPKKRDTDGDYLSDGKEINSYSTDPLKKDTDGDGLIDGLEVSLYETDPNDKDTDDGGVDDGYEVKMDFDPLDRSDDIWAHQSKDEDSDNDGLTNWDEVKEYGTDPNDIDTDDGGVDDGYEVSNLFNPLDPSDDLMQEVDANYAY